MLTPAQFEDYCSAIKDTSTWGGEPEIVALSRAFNIPIHIVQGGKPPVVVHEPEDESTNDKIVRISYHRKLYGLGEVSDLVFLMPGNLNIFFF
jgi:OTU domain-containing protein 6